MCSFHHRYFELNYAGRLGIERLDLQPPESARVHSREQHVQTPEAAKPGSGDEQPPAFFYSESSVAMTQITFSKFMLNKLSD